MPAEIPDEFIDLLEALSEERLDEAGRARLVAMAAESPELRNTLREHLALGCALGQLDRDDALFAERTAAHVMKTAGEGDFAFAGKVRQRILRRRVVKILAAAAVLTLTSLFFLPKKQEVATLVRMDFAGKVLSRTPVKEGAKFDEKDGFLRFDFENGAIVAVEAPAKLVVTSGMEIKLESGRLNAWCPEPAHGFKVCTASADLTDLGTSFGVSASTDGQSKFVVLDGSVEVEKGAQKMRLDQGAAATSSTQKEALTEIAFDASAFKDTWRLASGILSTNGSVIPVSPDIPEKVALMEDSEHVLVIPERRQVVVEHKLEAEITGPGTLRKNGGTFDGTPRSFQASPGKKLRSILLRYDPIGASPEDQFLRLEGEVTFDRPVLAISCREQSLQKSDGLFSTATWDADYRGIELEQIRNEPDSVTLSEDRKTVKILFFAGAGTDEVRVFLEED
jgi:hypothetical protein